MMTENGQNPRTLRESIGILCGWLSAGFSALFVFAFVLFATGFLDLREGGELAFAVIFLTVPPVLLFSTISLVLRGPRKAILAWVALCPFLLFFIVGALGAAFRR
jgi:hypothetical protein